MKHPTRKGNTPTRSRLQFGSCFRSLLSLLSLLIGLMPIELPPSLLPYRSRAGASLFSLRFSPPREFTYLCNISFSASQKRHIWSKYKCWGLSCTWYFFIITNTTYLVEFHKYGNADTVRPIFVMLCRTVPYPKFCVRWEDQCGFRPVPLLSFKVMHQDHDSPSN